MRVLRQGVALQVMLTIDVAAADAFESLIVIWFTFAEFARFVTENPEPDVGTVVGVMVPCVPATEKETVYGGVPPWTTKFDTAAAQFGVPPVVYVYVVGCTVSPASAGQLMLTACWRIGEPESITVTFVVAVVLASPDTRNESPDAAMLVGVMMAPVCPEVTKAVYGGVPPTTLNCDDWPTQVLPP